MEPNDEEQICMRIVDIIHNRPFCDEQWIKAASKGGTQGELRPSPLDDVYKKPDYTHQFETFQNNHATFIGEWASHQTKKKIGMCLWNAELVEWVRF